MTIKKTIAVMASFSLLLVSAFAMAGCEPETITETVTAPPVTQTTTTTITETPPTITVTAEPNPESAVSPMSLSFGEVEREVSSTGETITITNDGDYKLVIGTISLVGVDADQFAISADNASNRTLEPGESATVEIAFNPTSHGEKSAALSIATSDPNPANNPRVISLAGTGAVPAALIESATLEWESGAHNNYERMFVEEAFSGMGTDTYCGRCHSPSNWDPDAVRGPTMLTSSGIACFNCKIAGTWRYNALGTEAVLPDEHEGITCEICHEAGHGPDYALLNTGTGNYEEVTTPLMLCYGCHTDGYGGYIGSAQMISKKGKATSDGGTDTLIDEDANFLAGTPSPFDNPVEVGFIVYNSSDNSLATVEEIVSATELKTTPLEARKQYVPTDSPPPQTETYKAGDEYVIYEGPIVPDEPFRGTQRSIVLRGSAHANDIGSGLNAPATCIDCHDPHSLEASCNDCHAYGDTIKHDEAMAPVLAGGVVTCMSCHEDNDDTANTWIGDAFVPEDTRSHWIGRTPKACNDCHFEDNEWDLPFPVN